MTAVVFGLILAGTVLLLRAVTSTNSPSHHDETVERDAFVSPDQEKAASASNQHEDESASRNQTDDIISTNLTNSPYSNSAQNVQVAPKMGAGFTPTFSPVRPQAKKGSPAKSPGAALTDPATGDARDIALKYLGDHADTFNLNAKDIDEAELKSRHTSKQNGVTHLYFRQVIDGLEVANGDINISVTSDGRILSAGGAFAVSDHARDHPVSPKLSAKDAILAAAGHLNISPNQPITATKNAGGREQSMVFSAADISREDIPVELMYLAVSSDELNLVWDLKIASMDSAHYWVMKIDAVSGDILVVEDWVVHENYEVYAMPLIDPANGGRTIVTNVYLSSPAPASPYGWHDTNGVSGAEFTITRGNNAHAYEDSANNNASTGNEPNGGAGLSFNFPINLSLHPSNYVHASVANLFYWNNILHDVHYEYGFDEASGNFQVNNYGNGGLGGDHVRAEAQDGSGINNANMFTPVDGSLPRMQMYLGNGVTPFRDGSLDNLVIVHEYGHGVSTRLTGGPANSSCLQGSQSGGMGEGWSDWWGLVLTAKLSDTGGQARTVGTWLFGEEPDGPGIRPYPYSTDMSINPHTYADIGSGVSVPHGVGSIWCATIWEVYWGLVNTYGFDTNFYTGTGGNNMAMQLILDGLKLQPCAPTFLDARDAILAADVANYGGANHDILWAAFAKRGLGFSADDGGNDNVLVVTEAFDVPDDLRVQPLDNMSARGPVGGPFAPNSKIYQLTNAGESAVVNWTGTKSAPWLDLTDTSGELMVGGSTSVTLSINAAATSLPSAIYTDTIIFSNVTTGIAQSRTVTLNVGIEHLTELFSGPGFDLDFTQLIFTPDGSTNYYGPCILPAVGFPTDPTGGTTLILTDDSFQMITLIAATVNFFGSSFGTLFVGSNGYITFGVGDSDFTESVADHFSRARISALFDDLNPATGGTVSWKQLGDRVAVTYLNVPEFGLSSQNSFQIEIYFDGTISITYLAVAASDGLAGLSKGAGAPPIFVNSDFSALDTCVVADVPEIEILGTNGISIIDGDVTPSQADGTQFGSAAIVTGAITRTFGVVNSGTTNLTVFGIDISGVHSGDFSVISSPPFVSPAATSNLVVQFNPQAVGFRSAVITVNNDDASEGAYDFSIQGSGVNTDGTDPEMDILGVNEAVIADGDVTPSLSDGTDFGSADITTGLVTRTFFITNSGPDDLNVSLIEIGGTHNGDFTVVESPLVVPSGSRSNLVVEFNPNLLGTRTASINVFNNDAEKSVYDFAVQGNGHITSTGCVNTIALFYNSSYVDTTTGTSGEAYNMRQALLAKGYIVSTFTGLSEADFQSALSAADALLIPELEFGNLAAALSPTVHSVISNYVVNGGCMVLNGQFDGNNATFYNTVLGRSVTGAIAYITGTSTQTAAAAGTAFAGGTLLLPGNNGSYPWRKNSLPPGALSIYEVHSGGVWYSTVAIIPENFGRVIFMSHDWFDAVPVGSQDGGWDNTLGRAFSSCGDCVNTATNDIEIIGTNGVIIADGDATPSLADGTDFWRVDVDVGLASRTFVITNTGPDDLVISGVLMSGTHPADFLVLSKPSVVLPGTTSNLVIQFNPSSLGLRAALVTVFNNNVNKGAYDFALQGRGTNAQSSLSTLWINEINYDSPGVDADEFVEVAGVAGTDLSVYQLVLYNGSGNAPYQSLTLSGLVDNEGCGFGGVAFNMPGIQNGAPDGVALARVFAGVTSLVQFISYEGDMTAVGGPADGVTAESIGTQNGVAETLQLQGSGLAGDDYLWGLAGGSKGFLNSAQAIEGCTPYVPTNLSFSASGALLPEYAGAVTVIVFKTAAEGDVTAEIARSGTATQGVDYTISTTNISLAGAITSQTIVVTLVNDTVIESVETLVLTLVNVTGADVVTPGQFTLTIHDDDTTGQLVVYRFNTIPYRQPTTVAEGITASTMGLTSGTIEENITFGTYFPDEPYIEETGGWTSGTQSGAKAYVFTVTPETGYAVTVTAITFRAYATAAGPSAIGYNIAGGLATHMVNLPVTTLTTVSQPVTGIANVATAFQVMIQGWTNGSRATTGGGPFRLDDVLLYGTVSTTGGGLVDTDMDGMPDSWEIDHGLNPAVSNGLLSNADSDWMTDIEEYWADTQPTNGLSFFPAIVLTNPLVGTMSLVVDITSTARVYGVRWTTNLLDDPQVWPLIPPEKTGTGSSVTFTVTNEAPQSSYRTGVRLP